MIVFSAVYAVLTLGCAMWDWRGKPTQSRRVLQSLFVGLLWWVYLLIFIVLLITGKRSMG